MFLGFLLSLLFRFYDRLCSRLSKVFRESFLRIALDRMFFVQFGHQSIIVIINRQPVNAYKSHCDAIGAQRLKLIKTKIKSSFQCPPQSYKLAKANPPPTAKQYSSCRRVRFNCHLKVRKYPLHFLTSDVTWNRTCNNHNQYILLPFAFFSFPLSFQIQIVRYALVFPINMILCKLDCCHKRLQLKPTAFFFFFFLFFLKSACRCGWNLLMTFSISKLLKPILATQIASKIKKKKKNQQPLGKQKRLQTFQHRPHGIFRRDPHSNHSWLSEP